MQYCKTSQIKKLWFVNYIGVPHQKRKMQAFELVQYPYFGKEVFYQTPKLISMN